MHQPAENLQVIREVAGAFARLQIPYAIGGSIASSVLGIPRFTQDADLTVEPFPCRESELAGCFGSDYYISVPAIVQAVRSRSSFNIINTRVGFKVDVFIRKDRPFEKGVFDRRLQVSLPDCPEQPLSLVSAEDVVLLKLEWYRLGDETSDRQWSDILGVLRVQAGRLDERYMEQWASVLRVSDLLAKARDEVNRMHQ